MICLSFVGNFDFHFRTRSWTKYLKLEVINIEMPSIYIIGGYFSFFREKLMI